MDDVRYSLRFLRKRSSWRLARISGKPIIDHGGEIYQYVGDEIVVSWTMKKGQPESAFLNCFFAMKKVLANKSVWYHEHFGVVPEFKAGFHYGIVTTGEIGVAKKDIIFTGDVLNTTARIQGLCNQYGVDLLLSSDLKEKLAPPYNERAQPLGKKQLKGKDERVELFTINN